MTAGSSHPGQVTDWLSDIDHATSKQDLDEEGSVVDDNELRSQLRSSGGEEMLVKELRVLTGRQIAFMIYAFFKIKGEPLA